MGECNGEIMDERIFGSNDIRGVYPTQFDDDDAYCIGRAFCHVMQPEKVVVGYDVRLSSVALKNALIKGVLDSGVDVVDIGQCGTEMVYFTTFYMNLSGGIMITASHNPREYNGFKFVGRSAKPVSKDSGLSKIKDMAVNRKFISESKSKGRYQLVNILDEYVKHLLSYINLEKINPLKVVANVGNGSAGMVLQALEKHIPLDFVKFGYEPDGSFPNGVPNPMLVENRKVTSDLVIKHKADIGIAWDGDFDRCFLFDEKGRFVEGSYFVSLLAKAFLQKQPGEKIICDDRVNWCTVDTCKLMGGKAVVSKSGHSFIKEAMRRENAVYGGEMSSHHYFREFAFCDSGMIPWLLVIELLSTLGSSLAELLESMMEQYPCSGEINLKFDGEDDRVYQVLALLESEYGKGGRISKIDGLSVAYTNWRFNVRKSNTEPLLRINAEAKNDPNVLKAGISELISFVNTHI